MNFPPRAANGDHYQYGKPSAFRSAPVISPGTRRDAREADAAMALEWGYDDHRLPVEAPGAAGDPDVQSTFASALGARR